MGVANNQRHIVVDLTQQPFCIRINLSWGHFPSTLEPNGGTKIAQGLGIHASSSTLSPLSPQYSWGKLLIRRHQQVL